MSGHWTFFLMFWFGIPAAAAYAALFWLSRGWLRDFAKILGVFVASLLGSLMFLAFQWQKVGPDNRLYFDFSQAPSLAATIFVVGLACLTIASEIVLLCRLKGRWRMRSLYTSVAVVTFMVMYIYQAQRIFGVLTNHH